MDDLSAQVETQRRLVDQIPAPAVTRTFGAQVDPAHLSPRTLMRTFGAQVDPEQLSPRTVMRAFGSQVEPGQLSPRTVMRTLGSQVEPGQLSPRTAMRAFGAQVEAGQLSPRTAMRAFGAQVGPQQLSPRSAARAVGAQVHITNPVSTAYSQTVVLARRHQLVQTRLDRARQLRHAQAQTRRGAVVSRDAADRQLAQAYSELRASFTRMAMVQSVSQLFQSTVAVLMALFPRSQVTVYLVDTGAATMWTLRHGTSQRQRVAATEGLAGDAVRSRYPLACPEAVGDQRYSPLIDQAVAVRCVAVGCGAGGRGAVLLTLVLPP